MSLERFTRKKVVVAERHETAAEVARKMREQHVGAVVVVDGGKPVGIITDRDLALRVVADGVDPRAPVRDFASGSLVTAHVDDLVDQVVMDMRNSGVRRMPIVDDAGNLVGLVSLDDLLVLLAGELSTTAHVVMDNRGP